MARYRSKPVVIEAVLFDGRRTGEPNGVGGVWPGTCPDWLPGTIREVGIGSILQVGEVAFCCGGLLIGTLEGTMRASPGDYIIRGTQGELYPCKPTVFETKYQREEA